jgi:predicted dehydrogenase
MSQPAEGHLSRREMIKTTGGIAAASALAGIVVPHVHAGENNTIKLALVGCGGRGTGAAENALASQQGPTKLVAMADVFASNLSDSHKNLEKGFPGQVDVPGDRRFVGFDAYQKAMDCLKPGDVVILATPPAFRWVQFRYAIDKGLNVFMEKPVTVDGPTSRKMFKLGEESVKRGLKVGVGLMCRHCPARQELHDRIKNGEIGDVLLLRAYRMAGPTASAATLRREAYKKAFGDISELLYQIRRFHGFLWASGGAYSDFLIHNIDESCWMKDAWPVKAQASGGRVYRGDCVDQNFDTYSVEYTFADGAKLLLEGRTIPGCKNQFASYAHGTKHGAVISTSGHFPAKSRIFKGQNLDRRKDVIWEFPVDKEGVPYQHEWEHLMAAIRQNRPYNEVKRGVEASLVASMGRMAAHTGQEITFEQILNCQHEFAPDVDKLTLDGPSPLRADKDGKYPVPQPGINTKSEYEVAKSDLR